MADKAVLEIDVQSDAFDRFAKQFAEFTQGLQALPQTWQGSTDAITQLVQSMAPLTNAIRGLNRALNNTGRVLGSVMAQTAAQVSQTEQRVRGQLNPALRETQTLTRQTSGNIGDINRGIARWPALMGQMKTAAGLLGFTVSVAGMQQLMQRMVQTNMRATGAGMNWGQYRSLQTAGIGLLESPGTVAQNIARARFDITSAQRMPFQLAGISQSQLQSPQAAGQLLDWFYKKYGNRPEQQLLSMADASQMTTVFSPQDILRLRDPKQRAKFEEELKKETDIPKESLEAMRNLEVTISRLTTKIEATLAKPLGNLAEALTGDKGLTAQIEALAAVLGTGVLGARGLSAMVQRMTGCGCGAGGAANAAATAAEEAAAAGGVRGWFGRARAFGGRVLNFGGRLLEGGLAVAAEQTVENATLGEHQDDEPWWKQGLRFGARTITGAYAGGRVGGIPGALIGATVGGFSALPGWGTRMTPEFANEQMRKRQQFMDQMKQRRGFQTGTDRVTQTGLALIHQGEQITPAQGWPYTGGDDATRKNTDATEDLSRTSNKLARAITELDRNISQLMGQGGGGGGGGGGHLKVNASDVGGDTGSTPSSTGGSPSSTGSPGTSASVAEPTGGTGKISSDTKAVGAKLMAHMQQKYGLTKEQAAGFVGNLMHESGGFKQMQELNPRGGKGGWGWAQWTGSRRTEFMAYARAHGLDPRSEEANMGFMDQELQGKYKGTIAALKRSGSIEQATTAAEQNYEKAGIVNMASRYKYARAAAGLTGGKDDIATGGVGPAVGGGGGAGGTASSVLTQAQAMIGTQENRDKAKLDQYLRTGGVNMDPHDNAWCAMFVNATLGHQGIKGTGNQLAASFEKWGKGVDKGNIQAGDVLVTRGGHHVGFAEGGVVTRNGQQYVKFLAGNENDPGGGPLGRGRSQVGKVGEHWEPVSSIVAARRADGAGTGSPVADTGSPGTETGSPGTPSAGTRRAVQASAPAGTCAGDTSSAALRSGVAGMGGGGNAFDRLCSMLAPKPLDPNNWSGSNKQVAYTIRNAPGANIYMTATGMGSATA